MPGILDKTLYTPSYGILTTEDLRNRLLGRNLPPPISNSVDHSGFASTLQDIGNIIKTPIWGIASENIPVHYDEDEQILPFGEIRRDEYNVNNNRFIPPQDGYTIYNVVTPSEPFPDSANKVRGPYPTYSNTDQFSLLSSGNHPYVNFPFTVVDKLNTLTFQNETSLGLIGAQQLEEIVIHKVAQVEQQLNSDSLTNSVITPFDPPENESGEYSNAMKGEEIKYNSLPPGAVGWQEYNREPSMNMLGGPGSPNQTETVLSTEQRVNALLERTGLNQSIFLFDSLGLNVYVPNYEDRRLSDSSNAGTNSRYYIGSERSTNRGDKVTKIFTSDEFNGADGIESPGASGTITTIDEDFYWTPDMSNNFNDKTILSKTKELVNDYPDDVFINQTSKFFKDKIQDQLVSRGNAISKESYESAIQNGKFCRVWTVDDQYGYKNAIRKTGLFSSDDISKPGFSVSSDNASLSVLGANGIVKSFPTANDSTTVYKKYMLSLENLAWADNLADLPLSETGPGDSLSKNKGRIMWFPPYDLNFDENISANWTKSDFIGRGEPVFTYNNTTRSGQLRFKVLVDHPKVINAYRGRRTNEIERFLAGCLSPSEFLNFLDKNEGVSESARNEIEKKLNQQQNQQTASNYSASLNEKVLFPENVSSGVNVDAAPIETFLREQTSTNKSVKITVTGYASKDETNAQDLALRRAKDIKTQVISIAQSVKGVKFVMSTSSNVVQISNDANSRRVDIKMTYDAIADPSAQHKTIEPPGDLAALPVDSQIIDNIRIDETKYFDFVNEEYPTYFQTISEKIRYFHPGFHSTTPEGLNTRVTFLQQCTRQGPSIYDKDANLAPQNLAFGRPPVCILRIGDFIYSKVIINSLSINYNGAGTPQWDMNPSGIGVQPMMADITLAIDIIGGQSLQGPINRLQNALSFNYYANTEMYDKRSDKLQISAFLGASIIDGKKALFPQLQGVIEKISLLGDSPSGSLKQEMPIDQIEESAPVNTTDQPPPVIDPPTYNITVSDKNLIIECIEYVDGVWEITEPPNPVEVIVTDSITNSEVIKDTFETSGKVYNLNNVPVFATAFNDSSEIVIKEGEIDILRDQLAATTDPNQKASILAQIEILNSAIDDIEGAIPNVIVSVYFITKPRSSRKIKTFTIKDEKLN